MVTEKKQRTRPEGVFFLKKTKKNVWKKKKKNSRKNYQQKQRIWVLSPGSKPLHTSSPKSLSRFALFGFWFLFRWRVRGLGLRDFCVFFLNICFAVWGCEFLNVLGFWHGAWSF